MTAGSVPAGVSILLVLGILGLWLGVAQPPAALSAPLAVLLAWLPLAPALPAIFRGGYRAAGWVSMVGVLFAGFALMELVANPAARWWAAATLLLSVVMVVMQVRLIRNR